MIKRALALALSLLVLSSGFVFGNEAVKVYNLDDLTRLILEDNPQINAIDAQAKEAKIQYDVIEEDYDDLKENIEKVKKNLDTRRRVTAQNKEEYAMAGGSFLKRDKTYENYKMSVEIEESVEKQYKNMVKQQAQTMKQMESLVFMGKNAGIKKAQEIERLKLQIQQDYYNLLLLDEQIRQLQDQLATLNTNINIEETRRDLNMGTNYSVENLKSQKRSLEISIEEMKSNREIMIDAIKNSVGIDKNEVIEIKLEVPTVVNLQKFELDTLLKSFRENNFDLVTLKTNVEIQQEVIDNMEIAFDEDDNDYKLALLQLETDLLNLTNAEQSMEQYVKNLYFQYEKLREEVFQQLEAKDLAEEKLRQAKIQFELGLISKLELQMQHQEFNQSMLEYHKAFINLSNTRKEIDLVLKGGMATAGR
ncbi:TolC family protein [Alkaliphilus crotonatoxidans]